MGNGCSNNQRRISQLLAKHKSDFDPTKYCEIKSAWPSPRGTQSSGVKEHYFQEKSAPTNLEGRDQAVRKVSKVHSSLHFWLLPWKPACAVLAASAWEMWLRGTAHCWNKSLPLAATCVTWRWLQPGCVCVTSAERALLGCWMPLQQATDSTLSFQENKPTCSINEEPRNSESIKIEKQNEEFFMFHITTMICS